MIIVENMDYEKAAGGSFRDFILLMSDRNLCKVSNQSVQNIVNNYINVHVSIAVCLLFLLVCSITPTPSFNMIQHR